MFARSHLQLAERYLTAAAFWRYCTVSLQAPHSGNDLQGAALWILAVYRWGLGGAMFDPSQDHRWAVILAGGEGLRLRLLTRFVSGDDRPKQFCPFSGGRTLLSDTARRIGRLFSAERTVFSLVHSHELYYAKELETVPPERMFVQPADRGTLPAILYNLFALDPRRQTGGGCVLSHRPSFFRGRAILGRNGIGVCRGGSPLGHGDPHGRARDLCGDRLWLDRSGGGEFKAFPYEFPASEEFLGEASPPGGRGIVGSRLYLEYVRHGGPGRSFSESDSIRRVCPLPSIRQFRKHRSGARDTYRACDR